MDPRYLYFCQHFRITQNQVRKLVEKGTTLFTRSPRPRLEGLSGSFDSDINILSCAT